MTLEQRESRSSLAGVMISAAVEGLGLVELAARHAAAIEEGVHVSVRKLVERVEEATAHDRVAASTSQHASAARAAAPSGAVGAAAPDSAELPGGLPAVDPVPGAAGDDRAAGSAAPAAAPGPPTGDPAVAGSAAPAAVPGAATGDPAAGSAAPAAAPGPPTGDGATAGDSPGGAAAQTVATRPAADPPTGSAAPAAVPGPAADPTPATTSPGAEPAGATEPADAQRAPGAPADTSSPGGDANADIASQPADQAAHGALVDPSGAYEATAYPGDGAPQVQLASWMARRAGAADIPGPLPVMAALERSGLTNLPPEGGDAAGFFGMSRATWSVGPYAGFAQDPDLQLTWFLDRAAVVKAEHVAAADVAFGHDPGSWHEWITAALGNRDADSERGRGVLGRARELLDSAAQAHGPAAELAGDGPAVDARAAAASPAGHAVALARGYLGDPYRWGGAAPSTGFDCSGLVQYVYGKVGIELPRVTDQQFAVGQPIARDALRTGDIVFFRDATGYIHHEGIYVGDGEFLHAPHTGDVIKISSLSEPYYAGQFAGGRRVAELAAQVEPQVDVTRQARGSCRRSTRPRRDRAAELRRRRWRARPVESAAARATADGMTPVPCLGEGP
jgi:cell wall-associated NlpC family hydrolase